MVEILSNSNWNQNAIYANALMNYMTNGQLGDARIDKAWETASLNDLWCFFRWITQEKSYRQILPYAKPSSQVSLVEGGGSALRLFESLEYLLIPSEGCKIKGGLYFFCYMFYHGNGFEEKCLNLLEKNFGDYEKPLQQFVACEQLDRKERKLLERKIKDITGNRVRLK